MTAAILDTELRRRFQVQEGAPPANTVRFDKGLCVDDGREAIEAVVQAFARTAEVLGHPRVWVAYREEGVHLLVQAAFET